MSRPFDIPALSDGVVTLRSHTFADTDAVLECCLDTVTRQFTTIPIEYTHEMAAEYVTSQIEPSVGEISWAIEKADRYAGAIKLRAMAVDGGAGNLGFVTHPSFRGQGVMTAAVRLAVAHAFDTLGWQHVQWKAHANNWGSTKPIWRNGFPRPTFVPCLLVERGRLIDGCISTLDRHDPRKPSTTWEEFARALTQGV